MNSLTTKSLLACCAGVVSLLLSSSGVAQAEESSSDPRYSPATDPDWLQEDYLESLDMMGAARLINTYSGSGTAIVQFENITTQLDARFGSRQAPGDLVFGRCTHITAATAGHSDATGWAPGGNSCKIAWVMCFAGMKRTDFGGWPTLAIYLQK